MGQLIFPPDAVLVPDLRFLAFNLLIHLTSFLYHSALLLRIPYLEMFKEGRKPVYLALQFQHRLFHSASMPFI